MIDSLVMPWVNAQMMSLFLAEVAQRHADEFIVMVTSVRLKIKQNQLLSIACRFDLHLIGLQVA